MMSQRTSGQGKNPLDEIMCTLLPQNLHFTSLSRLQIFSVIEVRCPISMTCLHMEGTKNIWDTMLYFLNFPGGTSGKDSSCQCRRHRARGSIPVLG